MHIYKTIFIKHQTKFYSNFLRFYKRGGKADVARPGEEDSKATTTGNQREPSRDRWDQHRDGGFIYIYSLILLKKKVFVMTTNSPKA